MKNSSKIILIVVSAVIGILILVVVFGIFMSRGDVDPTLADEQAEEQYEEEPEPEEEAAVEEDGNAVWSVMVYMCGTDLESKSGAATLNITEMLSAEFSHKVNVVIETGGTNQWQTGEYSDYFDGFTDISTDELGYYSISDDMMHFEESLPLKSMGEADTLADFIKWAAEKYPAENYMLIMWDHGGGTCGGVCYDELHDGDSLSVKELRDAITKADIPIELVGFDACMMATLDTAEALQGYGHYLLASEETEPGEGWDYEQFLSALDKNPEMDGLALGKLIADGFMEKCKKTGTDEMVTLSVTDLTRIPALSASYKDFSAEMLLASEEANKVRTIAMSVARAENYGGNTPTEGYTNMVDLVDFIHHVDDFLNWNADRVVNALNDAVQYEVHGKNRKNANGISVFYPLDRDEDLLEKYTDVSQNPSFLAFMDVLEGDWDSQKWNSTYAKLEDTSTIKEGKYDSKFNDGKSVIADYQPSADSPELYDLISRVSPINKTDYHIEFTQSLDKDGHLNVKVTSAADIIQNVSFMLCYKNPDAEQFLLLGTDNMMKGDYDTGEFTDAFEGTWMTIGGQFVCALLVEQNEDYNMYTIPVRVNNKTMNLRAEYNYNADEFKILGLCEGIDEETGQSGRDIRELKAGDKVEFLAYAYGPGSDGDENSDYGDDSEDAGYEDNEESGENDDSDGDDLPMAVLGSVTWSDQLEMKDETLQDGAYLYTFTMTDVFGQETSAEDIIKIIQDGEVKSYK